MGKWTIGGVIIGIIAFFIGWILKEEFYKDICSINKFGCFVGWVAFKSPTLIITIVVIVVAYSWWKSNC